MSEAKFPRVGVGVIIIKNNKVLLLKRKASHGIGTWAFVGGHLEFNETLEECAKERPRKKQE
jgi:8-oxo-dGTP diphosphatase